MDEQKCDQCGTETPNLSEVSETGEMLCEACYADYKWDYE
jgi:formylmethanofuran dehydrogenase subunit E